MVDERITKLLSIIRYLFDAIRGDWTDPRWECRCGWEAISHLRALSGIQEEHPYRYVDGRTAEQFIEAMEKHFLESEL